MLASSHIRPNLFLSTSRVQEKSTNTLFFVLQLQKHLLNLQSTIKSDRVCQ